MPNDALYAFLLIVPLFIEMITVSFLKHCVDMVWHSVLTLLHEFKLTDIRLKQCGKFGIGRFRAFYLKPLLSVLQFAHKAMVMREAFIIAPH